MLTMHFICCDDVTIAEGNPDLEQVLAVKRQLEAEGYTNLAVETWQRDAAGDWTQTARI